MLLVYIEVRIEREIIIEIMDKIVRNSQNHK